MADIFSQVKRSEIMSRIRSKGTEPESRLYLTIRDVLGKKWRIDRNINSLPGCPDILVPSLGIAIFADGCFYHGCKIHGHTPKTNRAYWVPKLQRTVRRDLSNRRKLRRLGFAVWRIWEHELTNKNLPVVQKKIERRIKKILDSC